jgi:hypothetical protein
MRNRNVRVDRRGSVLLITIILILGLSVFLGSFVRLAIGAYRLSDRTFYSNSCVNLSEGGLEEALYALNNSDWTGWTSSGGHMNRTISKVRLGHGATGTIKVRVYDYATSLSPRVVAEGRATFITGPEIVKQIEITASKKSFWANGLVAKDRVRFKGGNAYVDSYDTTDPNHSTGGLYEFSKRKDNGSVGSVLVGSDAVAIGNAEIWGYVATGGSMPAFGPGGRIHGLSTPAGVNIDLERIRTDFATNLEEITAPTSFDQVFTNISGTANLGVSGAATAIRASSIENKNGEVTQILGDVTLVVTGDIVIKGNFQIEANSSMILYFSGDVDIGGNGLINMSGVPKNAIMYGTASSQVVKLHGNGAVQAAIYAPNADFEMKGGGSTGVFLGAVVVKTAFINGNFEFHYDEGLADLGSSDVYRVGSWRELIGKDQWVSL